jgi:uncharacterized membrane protein YgaE (UPF0421/DUF939 family)
VRRRGRAHTHRGAPRDQKTKSRWGQRKMRTRNRISTEAQHVVHKHRCALLKKARFMLETETQNPLNKGKSTNDYSRGGLGGLWRALGRGSAGAWWCGR